MLRIQKIFLMLSLAFLSLSSAKACEDSYCDYGGLYFTGGYNLINFGVDLYSVIDYSTPNSNWGGSCGLISSCNSCTDNMSVLDSPIYINTLSPEVYSLLSQNMQMMSALIGQNQLTGSGPIINPEFPYSPNPFPTTYPNLFPPQYPTQQPPMTPPPSIPPLAGCDNILIMCPTGPVNPTTPVNPIFPTTPNLPNPIYPTPVNPSNPTVPNTPTNPSNPTVPHLPTPPTLQNGPSQTTTQTLPTNPNSYNLPRGVTH